MNLTSTYIAFIAILIETKPSYIICICNCGNNIKYGHHIPTKLHYAKIVAVPFDFLIFPPFFEETNIMQESHKVHQKRHRHTKRRNNRFMGDDDWVGSDNPIVLNEIEKQCIDFYKNKNIPIHLLKIKTTYITEIFKCHRHKSNHSDYDHSISSYHLLLYCYISNFRYQKNNPIDIPTIQSEEMEQES